MNTPLQLFQEFGNGFGQTGNAADLDKLSEIVNGVGRHLIDSIAMSLTRNYANKKHSIYCRMKDGKSRIAKETVLYKPKHNRDNDDDDTFESSTYDLVLDKRGKTTVAFG